MNSEIQHRIHDLAGRQHGLVTRHQLLELGVSSASISRRGRNGQMRRVHAGVYALGPVASPWTREMAAVLACGGTALLAGSSAAALWEMRPRGSGPGGGPWGPRSRDIRDPDVLVVGANRGRRPGIHVIRVHALHPSERTARQDIPVTTPARTLLDLASLVGSRELERSTAKALREGLTTDDEIAHLLARHRGRPGTALLRGIVGQPHGPAFTRSEAEEQMLALLEEAGLPRPECNLEMGPYELDFFWRAARIAVEVDGFRSHGVRPRFEGDRRRDGWLAARGITVIRVTWSQVTRERTATAVMIGQALARAGPG